MSKIYKIAEEFSTTPGGRFKKNGPWSGEQFRNDVLKSLLQDAIRSNDKLIIVLDGTSGYGSSFLEEAFGGLVRHDMFDKKQLKQHLEIKTNDPFYEMYRKSADRYIRNADIQKAV